MQTFDFLQTYFCRDYSNHPKTEVTVPRVNKKSQKTKMHVRVNRKQDDKPEEEKKESIWREEVVKKINSIPLIELQILRVSREIGL
jgi:hypothetical protein